MSTRTPTLFRLAAIAAVSLATTTATAQEPFVFGRNDYATPVGGDLRRYIVSVPAGYDGQTPVPVVFMLHGTSGDGEKFYNISGWKELGETETILTVFPSSWHYCILDEGQVKHTTKWNSFDMPEILCPGQVPRDDIAFLRQVRDEVAERFAVDETRVYMAGFSNGGEMAARTAVEMSDVLAGVASSAGALPAHSAFTPLRKLPVYFMVGELDDRATTLAGLPALPMDLTSLFSLPLMIGAFTTYRETFGLASTYTPSGSVSQVNSATVAGTSGAPENVFRFSIVKGLPHQYPNGRNHPLEGARLHWDFLKGFRLP
jgi:polyhydroxybutyrate depolymerase